MIVKKVLSYRAKLGRNDLLDMSKIVRLSSFFTNNVQNGIRTRTVGVDGVEVLFLCLHNSNVLLKWKGEKWN